MSGPPRKPTALKLFEGNRGKRKIDKNEPKPPVVSIPMPDWMCPRGKAVWKRLKPILLNLKVLTTADVEMFAAFCDSYGRYVSAEIKVTKAMNAPMESEAAKLIPSLTNTSMKYLDRARLIAATFGLTPGDRSRISIGTTEVDDFSDLDEDVRRKES